MENKKLNCETPQCGCWNENNGCTIDENVNNGQLICEKGEERYEHQIFVVVEAGNVISTYSDKPEINVKILDLDNAKYDNDNKNSADEMRERIDQIEERYHQIF